MKRTVVSIIISAFVVVGTIYFFLVYAVNSKNKEFQKFKKKIESDSVSYRPNYKNDSGKATVRPGDTMGRQRK
jgi:uncharacterized alpha/beta hydrolase family protein